MEDGVMVMVQTEKKSLRLLVLFWSFVETKEIPASHLYRNAFRNVTPKKEKKEKECERV